MVNAGTDRRTEVRRTVLYRGELDCGGLSLPVLVRDVSPRGALIAGRLSPPAGSRVRLKLGPGWTSGRVSWAGLDRWGMHFDEALDLSKVIVPLAAPRLKPLPRFRRATLGPSRDNSPNGEPVLSWVRVPR